MSAPGRGALGVLLAATIALLAAAGGGSATPLATVPSHLAAAASTNATAIGNFSAALGRIVTLIGAAGGAVLAIAWARVALSWFSNDVSKKIQAKDRARDALVGSLIFVAALTGLIWGLAQWVLSGG